MKSISIYQTLENRDNPDEIEKNGPFRCDWKNSWLGEGYYFWDTFIENAHWWGKTRYSDQYIICHAHCDFCISNCFDLVGDTDHMTDFGNSILFLKEQGLFDEKTTVARVIAYMKEHSKTFTYEAIRVYGIQSISHSNTGHAHRIKFELSKTQTQYLDYKPAIQICIFRKKGLNLKNFSIIYPEEYNMDYTV